MNRPPDSPLDDRRFEGDLRATLDDLASAPAPDRLAARVASIPEREAGGRPTWAAGIANGRVRLPRFGQAALGLAAVGVAVVIVGTALGVFSGQIRIGSPATTSTPLASAPTSAPVSVVSTASPTPTPSASPSPSLASALPADFAPVSVTFVSADQGWVLGGTACGASLCPIVGQTLDGGRTWGARPAPTAPATDVARRDALAPNGTGIVRFADPNDGWVSYGPDLWATHDGGTTWQRLAVPGGSGAAVLALEVHAGRLHVVVVDPSWLRFRVASSPVAGGAWSIAAAALAPGGGPVPTIQLVLSGSGGWVLENDRTVVGGLRHGPSGWVSWQPPCLDANGPASLAASTSANVVAACEEGVWGPAPSGDTAGEHLYLSADGGGTFVESPTLVPLDVLTLSAATPSLIVAAGSPPGGASEVVVSRDAGRTWATARSLGSAQPLYLGFTTATQGVLITSSGMWMTYDGGSTWQAVTF